MTLLNLTPILDAVGGTAATRASFKAVAMRAGRQAVRVSAATVTFPTDITASWDGASWDAVPELGVLPVDCYWNIRVTAAGSRLEGCYILPANLSAVDFGDLIAVVPDTGLVDTGALTQMRATQQYVSNQVTYIDEVQATVFGQLVTVQATIGTAQAAAALAQESADAAAAAQSELAADLATVTASSASAQTAAQDAADSAAAAAAALAAIETLLTSTIDGNS